MTTPPIADVSSSHHSGQSLLVGRGSGLRWVLAVAFGCGALLACTRSESRSAAERTSDAQAISRDTAAATQTDSLEYHVTVRDGLYASRAMVTFRNTSADTAYFVNCNGATAVGLQREVNGVWIRVWDSVQDQCLSAPIVVAPGDTLRRPVLLFDGYHPDTTIAAAAAANEPAVYRIIWTGLVHHYQARLPFGTEPALPLRISNRFVLVGAPR